MAAFRILLSRQMRRILSSSRFILVGLFGLGVIVCAKIKKKCSVSSSRRDKETEMRERLPEGEAMMGKRTISTREAFLAFELRVRSIHSSHFRDDLAVDDPDEDGDSVACLATRKLRRASPNLSLSALLPSITVAILVLRWVIANLLCILRANDQCVSPTASRRRSCMASASVGNLDSEMLCLRPQSLRTCCLMCVI